MNRSLTIFQKLVLLIPFLFLLNRSNAQLLQTIDATINGPYNPQSLVSNVLLGAGVDVTNISFSGKPEAVGYFSGGESTIGIDRGILLTTGLAGKAPSVWFGPMNSGAFEASNSNYSNATDANLQAIATAPIRDVAVYTITFIPTSDTLRFRYCFASEEYPEYSCTKYNDIFGFFIQGPGYPVPTNIALIPGTNLPVAINNIHPYNSANDPTPDPCQPFNAQYYNSNLNSSKQPVYDGFTDVFTAMAIVTPCQSYTIKLAIADLGDDILDSGVFLEAKSFSTTSLRVALATPGADATIAEGCSEATITFSLPDPIGFDYPINLNLSGSATPGVDFQNLPANLFIPAGQTQVSYPITALEDGLAESLETIIFDVQTDACHRDTVYLYLKDKSLAAPAMQDLSSCVTGSPIELDATVAATTTSALVFSNTQDFHISDNNTVVNSAINVSGVPGTNLSSGSIRSVCLNITHGNDGDLDIFLVSPGGQVLELSTDNGATGDNYTNTCFTPDASVPITLGGVQAPASAAPFTGDYLPEGQWSDLWDKPNRPSNGTWTLKVNDDLTTIPASDGILRDWSITFTPSYEVTYQWASSPDLSCLDCPKPMVSAQASGIYFVTATDSYGCTVTDDVQISVGGIEADVAVNSEISCFGVADGSASVTVTNGGSDVTYQWSDAASQTGAEATNLSDGIYTVIVTAQGICKDTLTVTLSQPPLLELSTDTQDALCFGAASGNAAASVNGGTAPYQYAWSNGLTMSDPNSLAAGNYTITVTDANGCSAAESITIAQPSALQLSANTVNNVSCFNGSDGAIELSASGGAAPLTYQWSSGESTSGITGLASGTYTVTITDANACTNTLIQNILQPSDLSAFATPKMVLCKGGNSGELHADVNGGNPSYSFQWQGPGSFSATSADLLNLFAGNYSLTITDQKGCTKVLTSNISEPDALLINLPAVSDTICYSASNGSAAAGPSGGTAPYSFQWDNGQTGPTADGLVSQEYRLTVTDANGCSESAKTLLPQKYELNTYALPTLPKCHDGTDGSASVLSIYYGVTPADLSLFSYSWSTSPAQNTQSAQHLKADQSYSVTVTDVDGCTAQYSFIMGNPRALDVAITGSGEAKCHGEATGWAAAGADGGTTPYSWLWSAGSSPSDSVGRGLAAGLNRVTITDANGCPEVLTVDIKEPAPLQATLEATAAKCFGESSGSAKVTVSGGTSPYKYNWWNGAQTAETTNIPAGTAGLTVTDANGCTTPGLIEIPEPELPVTGTAEMLEPRCFGDHNGQIIITPSGGTAPYRFALDGQAFNGSRTQIGLSAGVYVPKVMDKNGCMVTLAPVEVTQKAGLSVDLGPDIRIQLGQDTQLVAQLSNVSGPYTLFWLPSDSIWLSCLDCTNPSVYSLQYGKYFEVNVIDSLGCRSQDRVYISVEKPRKVYVPTAFTPNGDLNNDLLLVHGQKTSKALTFRIYDRWGEMVYEGRDFTLNDENTGWDGTFRGQPMDPGVYIWVLDVEYMDGVTEMYKGNTTLIR